MATCMICGSTLTPDGSCEFCDAIKGGQVPPGADGKPLGTPKISKDIPKEFIDMIHDCSVARAAVDGSTCDIYKHYINCSGLECSECRLLVMSLLVTGVRLPQEIQNSGNQEFKLGMKYIKEQTGI